MIALALIAMPLAACDPSGSGNMTPRSQLPPVPADIQTCFRQSDIVIPDRELTAADVESLWKKDRVQKVVLRRCGSRFEAWYNSLRRSWK